MEMKKSKNVFCNKPTKEASSSKLRIGQLTERKEFESFNEDDDASVDWETLPLIDPEDPWYLRGAQVKIIEFVYFSEKDESTASEGDVLGETDDDISSIDGSEMEMSSSSSEDENARKKEKGEENSEDEEEEDELSDPSQAAVVIGILKNRNDSSTQTLSSKSDADSRSNPSDTGSNAGYTSESTKMILNKKLAVSSEEQKEAEMNYRKQHGFKSVTENDDVLTYDEKRTLEIKEQLLGQKVALYEKDMSDYLTGKKKDVAMRDTIKGASYWRIRKTLKLLKMADPCSTQIALSMLLECELDDPDNHAAIDDTGSVELLVNLLNVDWSSCRLGALSVLDVITEVNEEMVEMSMNLGMVEEIYRILLSNDDEEVLGATRCLCNLMSIKRSRTVIRKAGLIPILFSMIHRVPMKLLCTKLSDVFDGLLHRRYEIAMASLYILTTIMRSRQVREELFDCGYLSIVVPLLGSHERLIVKAVLEGILLCASLRKYRQRFEISGMIQLVLKHWKRHEEIVLRFVYKMSIGVVAREQIIESDALGKVVSFVMNPDNMQKDPYGFKYALACLQRVGAHHQAREFFEKLNLLEILITLLKKDPADAYKLYICSVMAQLSIFPENWKPIVELGGLECILNIIFTRVADMWMIANCIKILGDVAHGDVAREFLLETPETLHYLLTLLNDRRPLITRCSARAIIPMIRIYSDFAEVIKGEGESLQVLMDQLESSHEVDDSHVKSAVCEALAAITCDNSILLILRGLGLCKKIASLIHSEHEGLQESVCLLITTCSISDEVRAELGELGIIERIATFLKSPNIHVVIAAVNALWRLSVDSANTTRILSITSAIEQLLQWTLSEYRELSEAALGVLENARFAATTVEGANKTGNTKAIVAPEPFFPYHFKPQVFFHEEIELSPT